MLHLHLITTTKDNYAIALILQGITNAMSSLLRLSPGPAPYWMCATLFVTLPAQPQYLKLYGNHVV